MLRERLAEIQHNIWAHWMTYLFSVCVPNEDGSYTIPASRVKRWMSQIKTTYEALSEEEKAGDREQADKIIDVLTENR